MDTIIGLILLVVLGIIYFLPTIVAANRNHREEDEIWILNLFLGWTVIGWVVALIWAFINPAK